MLRAVARDTAVYGVTGLITRATAVVLLPLLAGFLAPSEIGILDLLAVLVSLAHVTVALEISQALARFYPSGDASERKALASTAFWFSMMTYALFAAVGLGLAPVLDHALFGGRHVELVRLTAVSTWAGGLMLLTQNLLRFQLRPRAYAAMSLMYAGISVGGSVVALVILHAGLPGVVVAQLAANVMVLALGLVLTTGTWSTRMLSRHLKMMLSFSAPLAISSLAVVVMISTDRLAINALLGLDDVGQFGVGYRVAQTISLVSFGFQLALTPLIYRRFEHPQTPVELAVLFRFFVAVATVGCVAVGIFAAPILNALTPSAFQTGAIVVPLLTPALLLYNMYVFAPGLSLANRTRTIAALNISGALLNTVLTVGLTSTLGIVGAALATLLSALAVFLGYLVLSQREYPIPHRWPPLIAAVAAGAAVVGAKVAVPPLASGGVLLDVALVGIVVVLVASFGLVRVSELRAAVLTP
jgi:O-antigen/teichoic acid export membrane protein